LSVQLITYAVLLARRAATESLPVQRLSSDEARDVVSASV
jgi:hypothetical protein